MLNDEIRYRIFRELERDPKISQRDLAAILGISVGKANFCLRALIDKGFVKVKNFRKSGNKLAYAYTLTPSGIAAKARLTRRFLRIKLDEYKSLELEIDELRRQVAQRQP